MICYYTVVEDTYRKEIEATAPTSPPQTKSSRLGGTLITNITNLYSLILAYQARVVCQMVRPGIVRYARNVVKADDWATLLEEIKQADSLCARSFAVLDSSRLQQGLEKQDRRGDELHAALESHFFSLKDRFMTKMRNDEESTLLQALFNSDYHQHKARNPDKVPGTCQWFFQNVRYKRWIEDSCSGLLWVTADPGCGKSVLSKSLIEHEDRNESVGASTTCYFFFKDDNADQKSVTKAVCALLHQLLNHCESPGLLKKAVDLFGSHGTNMLASFLILWKLFLSIAQDQEVGEVICILDALDECEEESQEVLIDALNAFHSSTAETTNGRLKILVTSRPYNDIRQRFEGSVIHLAGEEESQGIEQDIDLVIRRSVPRISSQLNLDPDTKSVLQEKLLAKTNRNYLWLHLVLEDVRKRSLRANTPKKMAKFLEKLPATVYDAYERILLRSPEPDLARRLLHIVLAATRPLTLEEMNMALNIEKGQKSCDEVDLLAAESVGGHIKYVCGLFISIIDSKVYLLHQTAREFLESRSESTSSNVTDQSSLQLKGWKHSMEPGVSHLVLADICLIRLMFDEDENSLAFGSSREGREGRPATEQCGRKDNSKEICDELDTWDQEREDKSGWVDSHTVYDWATSYEGRSDFDEYASKHWAYHFRFAKTGSDAFADWSSLCNMESRWFSKLVEFHWVRDTDDWERAQAPDRLEPIIVASFFGHDAILSRLISEGASVNLPDNIGRTALFWAASRGHQSTVEKLLASNAGQFEDKWRNTPLTVALRNGHDTIYKLLVQNGANLRSQSFEENPLTALVIAATAGRVTAVEYLLKQGASLYINDDGCHCDAGYNSLATAASLGHSALVKMIIETFDGPRLEKRCGNTSVAIAAKYGCWDLVRVLLEMGARPNVPVPDNEGMSPLAHAASAKQDLEITQVLLDGGADPHHVDKSGRTPLSYAVMHANLGMAQMLIHQGANPSHIDEKGRTPLAYAALAVFEPTEIESNVELAQMLIDLGADPNHIDAYGETPLTSATSIGNWEVAKVLIDRGADPNHVDAYGRTPLTSAIRSGNYEVAKILIDGGADPTSHAFHGYTPLAWARWVQDSRLIELFTKEAADIDHAVTPNRASFIAAAEDSSSIMLD